ncbi:MAG TPA: VanW family protein, partial [Anaerolineaceae bacterium]|nr:VanW family protein [Anaerolineaceae bacterium]
RVQNIQVGSSTFDGILIAPGEVFSMAKYMTNISLDNGYAEAIIIVGDQSVKGVGGGICQVSTTLFRTAFYGGYPIVERHSHAYRVGYYEQQSNGWANTNLAGLDASIYLPFADLKFKNDSDYWILMDTEMGPNSLTWKFYSTSDGRRVEWSTTGITDVVEPPEPIYREDPTLPRGTIKQVDWAVNGATVSVTRRVYKGDQLWFSDVINTTYMPWPDGFNYGPGTEIP